MELRKESHKGSSWRTLWGRTGFGETKLWDWLELLSVLAMPVVLVADRFWFTAQPVKHQQEIESDADTTPAASVSAGGGETVMTDKQLLILKESYRSLLSRS
jgi:hypothetical protein